MANLDMIVLSKELDSKLSTVLQDQETTSFNLIQSINDLFPTPESISTASTVLTKLKSEIDYLNESLYKLIQQRKQAQNPALFAKISKDITSLLATIQSIQQKASKCESTVLEITRDIKQLDHTKQTLSTSIFVLKRIHITVNGIEHVKGSMNRKQYHQVSELLRVLNEISAPLLTYKNIQQIVSLMERKSNLEIQLRKQIFSDFEGAFHGSTYSMQKEMLHDSCLVLELLENDAKNALCRWYIEMTLSDYRNIFKKNPEVAGLADISRRYAWFKRMLKNYDEQHSELFPVHWSMDELVTIQFCQETKRDLAEQMVKAERESTFDTAGMLQAIHTTLDFEQKLKSRFVKDDGDVRFDHIVSSGFDSFLWHYVDSEDQILQDKFQEYKRTLGEIDEGIYQSSFDLFLFYRQTMANCAQLSTGKAFFDLCKMYQKWLVHYDEVLTFSLKEEKKAPTAEDLVHVCSIINTADYCGTTTAQLEEKMIETSSQEFKQLVGFQSEVEMFMNTTAKAMGSLVKLVELSVDGALIQMSKKQWGQIVSVGDQSDYVTAIGQVLATHVKTIRASLTNAKFFRSFCDKFVEYIVLIRSFLNKFLNTIYTRCKPISEVGAEQILLDTHSINNILVEMTMIGKEKAPPPASFSKILHRGISKIDQLLKVVLRPHDPPEGIVETYIIVFPEHSLPGFQKILELKVI